ncbi:unannotated protein [freshwater metagenome]|uniref:Unannotated protein n=1 Tax=freshwater metagenome TaxID=449393 RepID=A0A6J7IFK0_9ZZZZ
MAANPRQQHSAGPVAIEVRDLRKSFRVPEHRVDSLMERLARPLTRADYRTLDTLKGISFDVHQGEFFGIVGRNGSGKSSLLKILASIYRADAGRVRVAGRMAPFIELGVGFNPELTGRQNIELNGVLMGLTRRETLARVDAILDFAELHGFDELKLKNYSSGMLVRLAFAVMVQAEADIMLVDEVLAVGDAAFARRCMEVFRERRAAGTTIVLVTHDMATVQQLCHRAMLIEDGVIRQIGDPADVALAYNSLQFAQEMPATGPDGQAITAVHHLHLEHAELHGADGRPVEAVAAGDPIRLAVGLQAVADLAGAAARIQLRPESGLPVGVFDLELPDAIARGERLQLGGAIANPLAPGHYIVDCFIATEDAPGSLAMQHIRLLGFEVTGAATDGMLHLTHDLAAVVDGGGSR